MQIFKITVYSTRILFCLILFSGCLFSQDAKKTGGRKESLVVELQNPISISRKDELIRISSAQLKKINPLFDEKSFFVTEGAKILPAQLDKDNNILVLASFGPDEKKKIVVHSGGKRIHRRKYAARTQAVLGVKTDYRKIHGYYTGGRFTDVDSATVPPDHFAHDALYRIEGPGWESDKVAYRFYLDSRNRNDIFGKKVNKLVLQMVGVNDLISDSKESYTEMLPWGMDIFKVGESLGIGSIAMWDGSSFHAVSKTGKVTCYIKNGLIESGVDTKYIDWHVNGKKYNLYSDLSISAGSRLTNVQLNISGDPEFLCTGLAKHEDCNLIKSSSDNLEWGYLALYGRQSLSGDNLGITVFYKKPDLSKITEDSTSYIIVLKPDKGRLNYYFGSAWQEEPDGIKNIEQFKKYLQNTAARLSNPIKINY